MAKMSNIVSVTICLFVSLFVATSCARGAEQFEGVVDDCTLTDVEADAVLFLDRPGDGEIVVFWGSGAPGTNQFTVTEVTDATLTGGTELDFSANFSFVGADGSRVIVEHEAELVREDDSFSGNLEVRISLIEGTSDCDVVLDRLE
jgi:hypothetical protein